MFAVSCVRLKADKRALEAHCPSIQDGIMCFKDACVLLKDVFTGKGGGSFRAQKLKRTPSWQGWLSSFAPACLTGTRDIESSHSDSFELEEIDARPFGTTRSYWLRRRRALFSRLLKLLKDTGEPELIDGIAEAYRCTGQIRSEAVRQNPQQLQIALQSFDAVCARISEAACTGDGCELAGSSETTVGRSAGPSQQHLAKDEDLETTYLLPQPASLSAEVGEMPLMCRLL